MYHIRQTHLFRTSCSENVLQRDIQAFKRANPTADIDNVLGSILKHSVPATVPGCPAYFRNQLKNLLAMVQFWGMPDFFLTLTADEHSNLKWKEIDDLEEMLHRFNNSYSYSDAPVECAQHFVQRLNDFMTTHILNKKGGVLGKVKHYVIRLEVQHRGSLHAHIILWCDHSTVDATSAEISASVPAAWVEASHQFMEPSDPLLSRLFHLVMEKQRHACRDDGCRAGHPSCKYGFPYDTQQQHAPVFDSVHNRWLYFRPRYEDRNIVPYHPTVLLLWGAHMNLQKITQTSWSLYVLKYAMKCEPAGHLTVHPEAMTMLGIQELDPAQLVVASALIMSKPVSPAEAALSLLQIPLIWASSKVTYVNSAPPALRCRTVSRGGTVFPHAVDKYAARPADAETHTFYSYFSGHVIGQQSRVRNAEIIGQDVFGNNIFAYRDTERVVRFTDYHPVSQTEAFFFNLLLQKVPFRSETDLLTPDNHSATYFEQCIRYGLVTTIEDIDALLQDYAQRHLQVDEQRDRLLIAMLQKNPTLLPMLESPNVPFLMPSPTLPHSPAVHPTIMEDMSTVSLNAEQQAFVDKILSRAKGLHFLTGGPGSGKTYVTKYLLQTFINESVAFLATATTGAASTRIGLGATTVHATFAIPAKKAWLTSLPPQSLTYDRLRSAKIIIVDEASMLTAKVWDLVMYRLLQVHSLLHDPEALLKQVTFILVGDHAQLSAVCYHRLPPNQVCTRCQFYSSQWWRHVDLHHLHISMRHSDPDFAALLNVMRLRQPTRELLDTVLGDCLISETELPALMLRSDATILCAYVEQVDQYNTAALLARFNAPAILPVSIRTSATAVPELAEWIADKKFHTLPFVAVGAKVMVLDNIDVLTGIANGTQAVCN